MDSAYHILSASYLADVAIIVPLHTYLLAIHHRGDTQARHPERHMARDKANPTLQPLGWTRL